MPVTGTLDASRRSWTTEEVEPRRALAYWTDTVCDRFLALDIETPPRPGFRATLDQVELGAATANFIRATSQTVRRTRARIARSDESMFVLMQLRTGHVQLRQQGRMAVVAPGESVLINATEPYELNCPVPTSVLALRLPHAWLTHWLPDPGRHAVRKFESGGWSSALNAALASLEADSCDTLALPQGTVADQLAALLTLAIGRDAAPGPDHRLISALRQTLREELHNPDLTPLSLAARHQMSKRRLHYAFAAAHTTFSEQLVQLRLEQARSLLADPHHATLPVAEVAARCGFLDPSHFARRFRRQYGQSPLAFRASVIGRKH